MFPNMIFAANFPEQLYENTWQSQQTCTFLAEQAEGVPIQRLFLG
jgi:hypothetical protein